MSAQIIDINQKKKSSRLLSLDLLRGLTVLLMILVNNGAGKEIYAQLQHSKWNGMTLCDLVFPFFLFMVGISTYLSLKKYNFTWSKEVAKKVAKRTILLFLIGLAINWFDKACGGDPFDFAHLRIMGVMQRIAICYGFTAALVLTEYSLLKSLKGIPGLIVGILIIYSGLILFNGGYNYDSATNILAQIDLDIFGYDHMYHKSPVDPEGLLSSLSAICNTLIGFCMADYCLRKEKSTDMKAYSFISLGLCFIGFSFLLESFMPYNKRIWSPSYVMVTCGLASAIQGLLIKIIDGGKKSDEETAEKSSFLGNASKTLLLVFGTNPLFLYVASEIIAIVAGSTEIKDACYNAYLSIVGNGYVASLIYAVLFVTLCFALGYPLYKKKIFIKL